MLSYFLKKGNYSNVRCFFFLQRAYSDWCHEFQKYRSALQSWEKRQNKCAAVAGTERLQLAAEAVARHRNQVCQF